ncbi:hypothetical protein [Cyanobacterium sp. Dongsha4]|uniref:hypothetical protein n=1 Tax=Cyanobacterium sp. DS4 TaxID=2878255 RepID=UPI002E80F1FB|nr:hypothetical protein [Cyanobacterium sp. Dongsha4]WVL02229.1 hypothetical protein Dongsha4_08575 [Cyanobacterium sp. Dongsha4]
MFANFLNTKNLVSLGFILFSVVSIGFLQKPLLDKNQTRTKADLITEATINESKITLLNRFPSFGFNNLIADWTYLDFIQYYGDAEARKILGYDLLPDYYRLIVHRDPRFIQAYFLLDPATTLFAGRPDVSVELMNYGLKYITPQQPRAYQVLAFKGTDELLFLGKTEEAEQSFLTASQWAKRENSDTSRQLSQVYRQTAQFLADNPDSKKARASSWLMILSNARDDQVRQIALTYLEKLGAEVSYENNRISVSVPDDIDEKKPIIDKK